MLPVVRTTTIFPGHFPVSNGATLHELTDHVIRSCLIVNIVNKDLVLILLFVIITVISLRIRSLKSTNITISAAAIYDAIVSGSTMILIDFSWTVRITVVVGVALVVIADDILNNI